MITHGRSTDDEGKVSRHNRDFYDDHQISQMAVLTAKVDNNNNHAKNNNNSRNNPIPRRYYNKLKDDYYEFKISDSKYHCPFCYTKDYSLTDLLRHAYRMAGNSRKTIKDIVKHSVLIILWYLIVNVDKNKPLMLILLVISHLVSALLAISMAVAISVSQLEDIPMAPPDPMIRKTLETGLNQSLEYAESEANHTIFDSTIPTQYS
ncbi:transmembrane protein, putative [Medicago truncatula]|uniref:Transmembrane protein, putative n=1 Tax=Medicago truncatula TaxID=3880 RepID=G7LFE3_MEDTR|nr:transmembrane protein, putative [Medicago truncatula]